MPRPRSYRMLAACLLSVAAAWVDATWMPAWPVTPFSAASLALAALWGRTIIVVALCAGVVALWATSLPAELRGDGTAFAMTAAARFLGLLAPALVILRVRRAASRHQELADSDPLTGLLNRRAFLQAARSACEALTAAKLHVTIAFFDIDRFKAVNDTHGHDAGDRLITAVARAIRNNTRRDDLSGRWGGDEFIVLLSGLTAELAPVVVGRLQTAMRAALAGEPDRPTVSVGVVSVRAAKHSLDPIIAAADRAMYDAKQGGGDSAVFTTAVES